MSPRTELWLIPTLIILFAAFFLAYQDRASRISRYDQIALSCARSGYPDVIRRGDVYFCKRLHNGTTDLKEIKEKP